MSAVRLTMMTAVAVSSGMSGRRPDRHGDQVADGGDHEQPDRDGLRHDQGRSGDHEGEREEERALDAVGQGHQHRRAGQRDRPLHDELGRAERVGRQDVVDEDQERAGEREEDQDRLLRIGPQAGTEDDGGRDEDEHPADDPDDAVVGVGRRAVDQRVVQAAGHGSRREPVPVVVPGARVVARRSRVAQERDEDDPEDQQVPDERGDDQGEGAFHPVILAEAPIRSGGDRSAAVRSGTVQFRGARVSASRTGRSA